MSTILLGHLLMSLQFIKKEAGDFADIFDTLGRAISLLEREMVKIPAAIYRSHSGGILDVLEDMKEKVEEQLASLRKTEMNAKHNFAMLKQSLEDQLKFDNKDEDDETVARTAASEPKPVAEGCKSRTEGSYHASEKAGKGAR